MKQLVLQVGLVSIVIVLCTSALAESAKGVLPTTEALTKECQTAIKAMQGEGTIITGHELASARYCAAYLNGVLAATLIWMRDAPVFCLPGPVTQRETITAYIDYIEELSLPQNDDDSAAWSVLKAFSNRWPCSE